MICNPERSGSVAPFTAFRKQFLVQKPSIVWCHYDLLRIKTEYRRTQTCLIFMSLDRPAFDVIPVIANESEQASLIGCCVLL